MNLGTLFEFAVERHPQFEALIQGNTRFTYREINVEINKVASALQAMGVEQGDRVVPVLKNRLEMVTLYWAVQKLGAVFTPINFRLSQEEIKYCVQDAAAKAIVYEPISEKKRCWKRSKTCKF